MNVTHFVYSAGVGAFWEEKKPFINSLSSSCSKTNSKSRHGPKPSGGSSSLSRRKLPKILWSRLRVGARLARAYCSAKIASLPHVGKQYVMTSNQNESGLLLSILRQYGTYWDARKTQYFTRNGNKLLHKGHILGCFVKKIGVLCLIGTTR